MCTVYSVQLYIKVQFTEYKKLMSHFAMEPSSEVRGRAIGILEADMKQKIVA